MKLYRIQELIDLNNEKKIVITKIKDKYDNVLIETKTKKRNKLIQRIPYKSEEYNNLIFKENNEEVDLISSSYQIKEDYDLENPILDIDSNGDVLIYVKRPYELIGELKYDTFTIIYNYLGTSDRIYETENISNIEYEDLSFNTEGQKVVKIVPEPPVYTNNNKYNKESPYRLKVLKESELEDGLIHEGILEDGRLFYDTYLGEVYRKKNSEYEGAYKRTSSYDRYLGKGYVTIEDGILDMNIYIPESGYYEIRTSAGNHFNNGTLTKVFLDNVGYYFRSPSDRALIWNKSLLELYRDDEEKFYEEAPLFLEEGKHNLKFEYDERFSTKHNDFDVLLLTPTKIPEAKNPFYIKTTNEFDYGHRRIIPMQDFYVDNDSLNMGTGQTLETVKVNGKYTSIEEVNHLSKKFTLLTGSLKNNIKLNKSGYYNLSILFRRAKTDKEKIAPSEEELIIFVNDNMFKGKVLEDHNDLCTIGLFKNNPNLKIEQNIDKVFLEKENEIKLVIPDKNNFIFDSMIINSEIKNEYSDVNPKALLYPNINDYYFIYENYHNFNKKNEIDRIDGVNSKSFNSIKEYKNEDIEFYLEKDPIQYAANNYDYQTRKINYDIIYNDLTRKLNLKIPIESYYLPKILMIHDEMLFDRYMIFKPFIFESVKFESTTFYDDLEPNKYNKYDAKLVPLQKYVEEDIGEIIYDLGSNWKEILMDQVKNLDDITFTIIYTRINK